MRKICTRCKIEKDETEYAVKLKGRAAHCKECFNKWYQSHYTKNWQAMYERREVHRKRRLKALQKTVEEIKLGGCHDCGFTYPPWVMDFDHVRDEKLYNVANMVQQGMSLAKVLEEIAKCDLVCANCHRERTYWRRVGNSTDF